MIDQLHRLTNVDQVTVIAPDVPHLSVDSRFSIPLNPASDPLQRVIQVGSDWVCLHTYWITNPRFALVKNLTSKQTSNNILEVALSIGNFTTPHTPLLTIHPEELAKFTPEKNVVIWVRSRNEPISVLYFMIEACD